MLGTSPEEDFLEKAGRITPGLGLRVPVVRTLPADLITPVSAWLRLRGLSSHSFLFESIEGGERLARYSFAGGRPSLLFRSWGPRIEIEHCQGPEPLREQLDGDPREVLRQMVARAPLAESSSLPRFLGGAVGFFGYDSVRLQEEVPRDNPDPLATPDLNLAFHDEVLAFDHLRALLHLVRVVELPAGSGEQDWRNLYAQALDSLDDLQSLLMKPLRDVPRGEKGEEPSFQSNISEEQFTESVLAAKEHILAGDIFQVVLSRRLSARVRSDPFAIYRALRVLNPSPYQFFLELGEHTLIGASPEMLVRVEGSVVETMPIAGTRRRGTNAEEDERLRAELLADPKERAEHEMLVDLGRNDIGRVSAFGSVELVKHAQVQGFSHVMHMVSQVRGQLAPGVDALDALYACFPAGTVSGAPKVRAMEIIEQLEPSARGVYAGAVGYLDYRGDLDTCIAIRTVVHCHGEAHVQAGAGIVFDSVPEHEYVETQNKAKALLEAIRWAECGMLQLPDARPSTGDKERA